MDNKMNEVSPEKIKTNLEEIYKNIQTHQTEKTNPELVIVTKNQSVETLQGVLPYLKNPIFGENRVNEALDNR